MWQTAAATAAAGAAAAATQHGHECMCFAAWLRTCAYAVAVCLAGVKFCVVHNFVSLYMHHLLPLSTAHCRSAAERIRRGLHAVENRLVQIRRIHNIGCPFIRPCQLRSHQHVLLVT
jgi:hypothetical protein